MSKVKEKRRARGKTPSRKGSDAGKASSGSWRRIRENAEAVLVAIILALIIRHFSLEAFEIPTGSMAPGLNGVHVVATCPNCDTSESIGIETDPLSGKVRTDRFRSGIIYEGPCPECGGLIQDGGPQLRQGAPVYCAGCREHRIGELGLYRVSKAFSQVKVWCHECTLEYTEIFEPRNCLGGHKILVNKFTYQTREPRRWEVIVFKFNRQRNYIKRLVGLPGESIRVRDGDIWIDGALERKPQWAQDDLWFPVHDTSIKERGLVREPAWREDGGRSWQPEKDTTGFRFNALEGSARLRYQRPIFNRYSYNQVRFHGSRREARIRDLRVVADLTLRGGKGRVALDVVNGDRTYRCSIPAGGGGEDDRRETILGILEEGAEGAGGGIRPLKILSGIALERDLPHLLDFSVADRQMVLRI
ncbi:MAG: signal peptidase I, partial [Planctomycetota bacterium]